MHEEADNQHTSTLESEQKIPSPYTALEKTLDTSEQLFDRRWTVFKDIDNTGFREGIDNQVLRDRIEKGMWGNVDITGRSLTEVVDLIKQGKLEKPHAVATRVGTRMFVIKEESLKKDDADITEEDFVEDEEYIERAKATGFDKDELHQRVEQFIGRMQQEYPEFNLVFQIQETAENWKTMGKSIDPFKLSLNYTVPADTAQNRVDAFLIEVKAAYPGLFMATSIQQKTEAQTVWFLDILPFGKDEVVRYLSKRLDTKGLVAGDSGNDILSLFADYGGDAKDFLRVSVGGSTHDLLQRIADTDITDPSTQKSTNKSWRRLLQAAEDSVASLRMYSEKRSLLGPQSVARAMLIAERAWDLYHRQDRPSR